VTKEPSVTDLLATAVAALGGSERPGQVRMAEAVARAFATGEHLAGRPAPAPGSRWRTWYPQSPAIADESPVVVSTATIALQRQLVDRDLPRLVDAVAAGLAPADFRAAQGPAELPVPEQDPRVTRDRRRRAGRLAGGAVRAAGRHRTGPRRGPPHRVGVVDGDR
jgi:hypothetical protein